MTIHTLTEPRPPNRQSTDPTSLFHPSCPKTSNITFQIVQRNAKLTVLSFCGECGWSFPEEQPHTTGNHKANGTITRMKADHPDVIIMQKLEVLPVNYIATTPSSSIATTTTKKTKNSKIAKKAPNTKNTKKSKRYEVRSSSSIATKTAKKTKVSETAKNTAKKTTITTTTAKKTKTSTVKNTKKAKRDKKSNTKAGSVLIDLPNNVLAYRKRRKAVPRSNRWLESSDEEDAEEETRKRSHASSETTRSLRRRQHTNTCKDISDNEGRIPGDEDE